MRLDLSDDGLGMPGRTPVTPTSAVPSAEEHRVFRRPELLTHPNIPKPLHGVNPRTVMGKEWWDRERRAAYERNGFHCFACGTHRTEAHGRPGILEAHEAYRIDYARGRVELEEIVALCHFCHNFIHSGRLYKLMQTGEISRSRFEAVMQRGFGILRDAGLAPWWGTAMNWIQYEEDLPDWAALDAVADQMSQEERDGNACWHEWRLVIGSLEFPPLYPSFEAWRARYDPEESEP